MKTILLVEDDENIMRLNRGLFQGAGYRVMEAETVAGAETCIGREKPDVIVLDIMLPDGDGLALCRRLRGESTQPPILFLSARTQPAEIVEGLQTGGDGYLTKPYDLAVLLAHVEMLRRRAAQVQRSAIATVLRHGPLTLETNSLRALLAERDLFLTPKEFLILLALASAEGKHVSSAQLYQAAWGSPSGDDTRAVRQQISRLRGKLDDTFSIAWVHGEGYRLIMETDGFSSEV